jgi:CspA family cold shock protein
MKEKGTVKWFNAAKGLRLCYSVRRRDVFVHFLGDSDGSYRTLDEGSSVEFDDERSQGLQVTNVTTA